MGKGSGDCAQRAPLMVSNSDASSLGTPTEKQELILRLWNQFITDTIEENLATGGTTDPYSISDWQMDNMIGTETGIAPTPQSTVMRLTGLRDSGWITPESPIEYGWYLSDAGRAMIDMF